MGKYTLTNRGRDLFLNDTLFLPRGLRCSNALMNDMVTQELVDNLKVYTAHGLNTISVFFMGNRFGNVKGYREDCSLDPVYAHRMEKIIAACDALGMVVIVGCLYWDESESKWAGWTQVEANKAIENTAIWLTDLGYKNVIMDVDNESMAQGKAGFSDVELIQVAKKTAPWCLVASNYIGDVPECADMGVHFARYNNADKPYIESEGVAENAPGGYWQRYSRLCQDHCSYGIGSYKNYINIGYYTPEMKQHQFQMAEMHFSKGQGYLFASTWLQAAPPLGPHHEPGGDGSISHPGMQWWLDYTKKRFGAYRAE